MLLKMPKHTMSLILRTSVIVAFAALLSAEAAIAQVRSQADGNLGASRARKEADREN